MQSWPDLSVRNQHCSLSMGVVTNKTSLKFHLSTAGAEPCIQGTPYRSMVASIAFVVSTLHLTCLNCSLDISLGIEFPTSWLICWSVQPWAWRVASLSLGSLCAAQASDPLSLLTASGCIRTSLIRKVLPTGPSQKLRIVTP